MAVARGALVGIGLRGVCLPALLWLPVLRVHRVAYLLGLYIYFFLMKKHIKNKTVQRQTGELLTFLT